jgi:hypothetical protein
MPTRDPNAADRPSGPAAAEESAKRVLAQVAAELNDGDRRRAARHFLAGVAHESMSPRMATVAWVREVIGKELTDALIAALAAAPCFGCKLGYQDCERCGGDGMTADAQVCRTCVGFGRARCEFCSGSGLATYNALPADFRPHVMARRVARAIALIDRLKGEVPPAAGALPASGAGDATDPAAFDRDQILRLNKLLGVLENAVIAARTLIRAGRGEQADFAPMAKRVISAAAIAEAQMRQSLRRLSASGASGPAGETDLDRADREARSTYYRELADSPHFEQTGLEHFFLHPHQHGATARLQERAAVAAGAEARREAPGDAATEPRATSGEGDAAAADDRPPKSSP